MRRMVDMARSTADKIAAMESVPTPVDAADYPWGLRITLDEKDLEKLDVSEDIQAGDMLHFYAMAKVTNVSTSDSEGGKCCNVTLQIQSLAVEDEAAEEVSKVAKRYGTKG
jgi:hypothetical protein